MLEFYAVSPCGVGIDTVYGKLAGMSTSNQA